MAQLSFIHLSKVESTQDIAKQNLQKNDFVCVLADQQISGRGRSGNKWESSEKDFICSVGFNLSCSIDKLISASLVAGVSILERLNLSAFGIGLKWPNDLVHLESKRKLGGILIESIGGSSHTDRTSIIIGIGINYYSQIDDKPKHAIGLYDIGFVDASNQQIAQNLANHLREAFITLANQGFEKFRTSWQQHSVHIQDKSVLKVILDPDSSIIGTYCGLTENGMLLLRTDSGLKSINTGHVESW
jgi:biotin-[acetyl-CoA-carboxylase] ligase BirA-like protein